MSNASVIPSLDCGELPHGSFGAPSGKFPISVIILTYNEETNIAACLSHLQWADDVVVVDSFSTDQTIDVACAVRPDIRVFQNPFQNFGDQRNWALDHTRPRHSWILFLDADERCNADCAQAIRAVVESPGENVACFLTCRNMFFGRWLRRCTLHPSWQLRLLKLGHVRFQREGHGQREVADGPLGYIHEPYDHFGFSKGVAHWVDRHNRYSSDEVELIERLRRDPLNLKDLFRRDPVRRRRCLKRIAARVGFRPLFRFMYIYVVRGGFLDGWPGLWYCLLRLGHEIHITVKLAESRWNGTRSVSGEPRKGCESKAQSLDEARPVAGAVAGERSVST